MRSLMSLAVLASFCAAPAATAQIIGVDFNTDAGATIPNWHTMTQSGSIFNLTDDTGMATGANFSVNVGSNFATTPSAATVPTHSYPLDGIANYFFSTTPGVMTFSNLDPTVPYDVWVFGLRGFTMNNAVTVTGATQTAFTQVTTVAGQLWVNGEIGTSTRTLDSYAITLLPSANGELRIDANIVAGGSAGWTIAGVAVRPIPEPATAGLLAMTGLLLLRRRS